MSARPLGSVGVTSVVTGVLAYATLIVFARLASETAYVAFAVLWAAYYGVAAAFAGLQQDVTRAVLENGTGVPLWRPAAVLVFATSAVTAIASPWWGRGVGVGALTAVVVLLALCSLGGLVVVLAVLAADGDWTTWSLLLVLDSVVRLVAVTVAARQDAGLAWQAAAIGSGSVVWLPLLARRRLLARRVGPFRALVSSALAAMSATGFAALVVAGLPLLAAATSRHDLGPSLAGLLAALVLFRSPVLLVVNAYRPMLVVRVVEGGRGAPPQVWRLWRVVLAGGALAASAAYAIGPWLLRTTWGQEYVVTREDAALLVVSAVALTLLTISSTALIATGRARMASASWLLTVASTVVLLLVPDGDRDRILAAALLGPLPALVWHAVLLRARRTGEEQE